MQKYTAGGFNFSFFLLSLLFKNIVIDILMLSYPPPYCDILCSFFLLLPSPITKYLLIESSCTVVIHTHLNLYTPLKTYSTTVNYIYIYPKKKTCSTKTKSTSSIISLFFLFLVSLPPLDNHSSNHIFTSKTVYSHFFFILLLLFFIK